MALSDSMFLFEIIIEELKSFVNCKEFYIKSQFAHMFDIILQGPNDLNALLPKYKKKNMKSKMKVRNIKAQVLSEPKVQSGQSILLNTSSDVLISNMKKYPMELSLWSRVSPENRLGSTLIPWNNAYLNYLNKLHKKPQQAPVTVAGTYNIFDEFSSKCMAIIKLNIKLSKFKDKITRQFRSLSDDNQHTFKYTGFNRKPTKSTIKNPPINWKGETGVTKTIYGSRKQKCRGSCLVKTTDHDNISLKTETILNPTAVIDKSLANCRRNDTDKETNKELDIVKSRSCESISREQFNILDYIFSDNKVPIVNQVYCVNYFTMDNNLSNASGSPRDTTIPEKIEEPKERYKFKICSDDCRNSCMESVCEVDLPAEAENLITTAKCKHASCNNKRPRETPLPPDDRILLDLTNLKTDCCDMIGKVEVVGGVTAKMQIDSEKPCFCECECKFGFIKRTTYCNVCGGYEATGEDLETKSGYDSPFPCPIYHKLVDKNKMKTYSNSGSEGKKKPDGPKSRSMADKSESERDSKKGKKKKKDDRFKFNYGYTAPKIGHSQCGFPCTGTLGTVPKSMGWLWTADNVPGLKFRPMWKPGATNKHVVRLLRMAKNPGEIISKKKKKDGLKKKPLKRPLLVVHKKDGEYTVTMEPVKQYTKTRAPNQYPYEDKPVLTYTIGRTEEENKERQRKKERARRRLERSQREFIQSAFRDMCQEICLKTYQQALGILPDTENPTCPCYPADPGPDRIDLDHSCSCSEDKSLTGSDTDSDEWFVEFTPPNATFDPTFKSKKVVTVDNTSQYNYLDYRVKLLDRFGNPVPRFFKGPDGKQQCSDLGGFWSPNKTWLEINVDGYIAPDQRWAPNIFIGPNGETIETESGKFQAANGKWLVVGIDGFIDCQGRWKFYPRPFGDERVKQRRGNNKKTAAKRLEELDPKKSLGSWSCFGDASPIQLSKMGIIGHGPDKKLLLAKLREMIAQGEDVTLPVPSTVPRRSQLKKKNKTREPVRSPDVYNSRTYFEERTKCRHPVPSEKGIIARDVHGHRTYFRMKERKNKRPADRFATLKDQRISLSSFHAPCFHSFISTDVMKKQQYDRIRALYPQSEVKKHISTQAG